MARLLFVFIFALTSAFCSAAETTNTTNATDTANAANASALNNSPSEASELRLAKNAPRLYTVHPGDTLWGVASKFLAEPWRWPEIWRMDRQQIKNPRRIFPGDVIVLEYDMDRKPLLRIQSTGTNSARDYPTKARNIKLAPKIYSDQRDQSLPAIPPNVIEPFISAPLIVEEKELENAAHLVAASEDRVFLGKGDIAYVEGADPAKEFWQIYRDVKPLYDPENPRRVLGYEAFHLGTAKQIRLGSPATFEILSANEEIGRGDRLRPSERPPLIDYIPHKPDFQVEGRIISVYGNSVHSSTSYKEGITAGVGSIVSVNRGTQDEIEVGHVLAIERNRTIFVNDKNGRRISMKAPPERSGLLFVFRTFDRISYALIVHTEGVVETNDFVRTP